MFLILLVQSVLVSAVFFASFVPWVWRTETLQRLSIYFSPVLHMMDFARGVVDTRAVAFYLINTALVLFATIRALDHRSAP